MTNLVRPFDKQPNTISNVAINVWPEWRLEIGNNAEVGSAPGSLAGSWLHCWLPVAMLAGAADPAGAGAAALPVVQPRAGVIDSGSGDIR